MQAALDAANVRLAELAKQHAPTPAPTPPRLARELATWGKFELSTCAAGCLDGEITSPEFFERLMELDCLADARRVLAHALPKRRALWWGVLAAWDVHRQTPQAELPSVLAAVTAFIHEPTEDRRRACDEWRKRAPKNSIAGCLATAAFFSAGSVSLPGLPPVAPRPFVTGRLVGVAIYLAAVARSAPLYKQYQREYLRWGRDIASGRLLWPRVEPDVNELRLDDPATRLAPYWESAAARTIAQEVHA
jgi:hypothetical protein